VEKKTSINRVRKRERKGTLERLSLLSRTGWEYTAKAGGQRVNNDNKYKAV